MDESPTMDIRIDGMGTTFMSMAKISGKDKRADKPLVPIL
jgi:hypothetical protein